MPKSTWSAKSLIGLPWVALRCPRFSTSLHQFFMAWGLRGIIFAQTKSNDKKEKHDYQQMMYLAVIF